MLGTLITYVILAGATLIGIVLATGARLADALESLLAVFDRGE